MTEPKPGTQYSTPAQSSPALTGEGTRRAVPLVLSLDWAQAVTRLQQLHNEGCELVRLLEDESGRVRVEPGG